MENITNLPETFEGRGEGAGYFFTQVKKSDTAYMYEAENDSDFSVRYEVFKRISAPVCLDFAARIYSETERKELYPKANSFGLTAWAFTSKPKAELKFTELCEKE